MEEVINNHLQRMNKLQSIYEEGTGQHNILGILINELTEQLRQYNVVGQSEQLTAFAEYCDEEHGLFIPSWMIDGYNKSR